MKKLATALALSCCCAGAFATEEAETNWKDQVREDAATISEKAKEVGGQVKEKAVEWGTAARDKAVELKDEAQSSMEEAEAKRQDEENADPDREKPASRFFYK